MCFLLIKSLCLEHLEEIFRLPLGYLGAIFSHRMKNLDHLIHQTLNRYEFLLIKSLSNLIITIILSLLGFIRLIPQHLNLILLNVFKIILDFQIIPKGRFTVLNLLKSCHLVLLFFRYKSFHLLRLFL